MGIPIGKLALYTAVGGVDPERTLPVFLDVGTENETLLSDPLYLGWRHRRLRDDDYDELVDAFVDRPPRLAARACCCSGRTSRSATPTGCSLATAKRICSFNDDIQGTAAVAVAAIVGGMRISDTPLSDLRLVIVGAGSAGIGIAHQATAALVAAGVPDERSAAPMLARRPRRPVARPARRPPRLPSRLRAPVGRGGRPGRRATAVISLLDVVVPTSTARARRCHRPTRAVHRGRHPRPGRDASRARSCCRCRTPPRGPRRIPADVLAWTDGRALVGTGSPFPPVTLGADTHVITQVNNLYLFPGLGRGVDRRRRDSHQRQDAECRRNRDRRRANPATALRR